MQAESLRRLHQSKGNWRTDISKRNNKEYLARDTYVQACASTMDLVGSGAVHGAIRGALRGSVRCDAQADWEIAFAHCMETV
jgi:hypothetical protein